MSPLVTARVDDIHNVVDIHNFVDIHNLVDIIDTCFVPRYPPALEARRAAKGQKLTDRLLPRMPLMRPGSALLRSTHPVHLTRTGRITNRVPPAAAAPAVANLRAGALARVSLTGGFPVPCLSWPQAGAGHLSRLLPCAPPELGATRSGRSNNLTSLCRRRICRVSIFSFAAPWRTVASIPGVLLPRFREVPYCTRRPLSAQACPELSGGELKDGLSRGDCGSPARLRALHGLNG